MGSSQLPMLRARTSCVRLSAPGPRCWPCTRCSALPIRQSAAGHALARVPLAAAEVRARCRRTPRLEGLVEDRGAQTSGLLGRALACRCSARGASRSMSTSPAYASTPAACADQRAPSPWVAARVGVRSERCVCEARDAPAGAPLRRLRMLIGCCCLGDAKRCAFNTLHSASMCGPRGNQRIGEL